jgi:hypothetical protein
MAARTMVQAEAHSPSILTFWPEERSLSYFSTYRICAPSLYVCPDHGKIVSHGDLRHGHLRWPVCLAGDSRRVLAPPADLGRFFLD